MVVEHLDEEERLILPIVARTFAQDEWAELGQASVAKMSRSELPLMFGAVMEGAEPDERAEMMAVLPTPVRLLMRAWGLASLPALHHPRARGPLIDGIRSTISSTVSDRPHSDARRKSSADSSRRIA